MTEPLPRFGARACVVALASAALGLAATFSLTAVLPVRFPHGPGAAGFPAFYYYREGLELAAFLLTALLVPIAIVAGLHVWSRMVMLLRDRLPEVEAGEARSRATVPFIGLLAVVPSFPLVTTERSLDLGLAALAALGLFMGGWWFVTRPPRAHVAVALAIGAVAGTALSTLLPESSLLVTLLAATAGGAVAAFCARRASTTRMWLLPIALIPLTCGLGVSLVDGGAIVGRQGLGHGTMIAIAVSLLVAAAMLARCPTPALLRGRILGVAGAMVLAGVCLNPGVDYPDLDVCHEGEWLASAQMVMNGSVPFRDVQFLHGLGHGLRPLMAFRLFGTDVRAVRLLDTGLVSVAALAACAVAAACLGPGGLAAAMILVVAFGPVVFDLGPRTVVAWAALVPFLLAIDLSRRWLPVCAGLAAVVATVWAFDTGGAILIGEAATVIIALTLAPHARRALAPGFAAGAGIGLGAVVGWLAVSGTLGGFLASEADLLEHFDRAFGRPFLFALQTAPDPWLAFFVPVVVVVALSVLLWRAMSGPFGRWELKLALLVAVSGVMYKRALDRSDFAHIILASVFAWLPALMLLGLLFVGRARRVAAGIVLAGLLILPTPQLLPTHRTLIDFLHWLGSRGFEDVTGRVTMGDVPRLGLRVSPEQAEELEPLLRGLMRASNRAVPVLDFTNSAALLFLANRPSAIPYAQVFTASSPKRQDEIIRNIERERPLVIFRSGTDLDRLDRIDNLVRHHRIAAAINRFARAVEPAGGYLLVRTRGEGAPTAADSPVDGLALGHLAFVWGDVIPGSETLAPWRWDPRRARALNPATGRFEVAGPGPAFAASLPGAAVRPPAVVLDLTTTVSTKAALSWSDPALREREFSVSFEVVGDGQRHAYWVPLENHPGWAWARDVGVLVLAFEQAPGVLEIGPLRATRLP